MDMFNIMGKLAEAKEKMEEAKEKLPFIEVVEYSEDYSIKVLATANKEIKSIEIKNELLDPAQKDNLQEKLKEVINAVMEKAGDKAKEEMKKNLEGVIPNIPGIDLGNLPI